MDRQALQIILLSTLVLMTFIGMMLVAVVNKLRPGVQKKKIFYYVIAHVIPLGLALLLLELNQTDRFKSFVIFQIISFVLGILHTWLMFKLFAWAKKDKFWAEFWFSLAMVFFIGVGLLGVATWREWVGLGFLLPTALLFYLVPFLMLSTFESFILIPVDRYKLWYYPVGGDVPNPLEFDLTDHMKIIAFEFEPQEGSVPLNIKIKAPERMELGHYFMSFIEQYNLRNPEKEIKIYSESGSLEGWLFKLKRSWFKSELVFDAEMTINDNGIKENDVIIVERVKY
jgi:hypothetical protein